MTGPRALGIDAAGKYGWVGVVVDGRGFHGAFVGTLGSIITSAEPVDAIGIDIPISSVVGAVRQADAQAWVFVGKRRASVFAAPSLDEIGAQGHTEFNAVLAAAGRPKISAQAWALLPKMREAAAIAATDERVHEVHPEVSFREMHGVDLEWSKKSWNGQHLRRRLLSDYGIELPDELPDIGGVLADDLLDAAAAAWSARRIARGEAKRLPSIDEFDGDRLVAIWY